MHLQGKHVILHIMLWMRMVANALDSRLAWREVIMFYWSYVGTLYLGHRNLFFLSTDDRRLAFIAIDHVITATTALAQQSMNCRSRRRRQQLNHLPKHQRHNRIDIHMKTASISSVIYSFIVIAINNSLPSVNYFWMPPGSIVWMAKCVQCDKGRQAVEGLSRIGVNPLCWSCSSENYPNTIPNPDLEALNNDEQFQKLATKVHKAIVDVAKKGNSVVKKWLSEETTLAEVAKELTEYGSLQTLLFRPRENLGCLTLSSF